MLIKLTEEKRKIIRIALMCKLRSVAVATWTGTGHQITISRHIVAVIDGKIHSKMGSNIAYIIFS